MGLGESSRFQHIHICHLKLGGRILLDAEGRIKIWELLNLLDLLWEYFWRNSEEFRGEKFRRISQEFLETESQNCDPTKISNLWDQF